MCVMSILNPSIFENTFSLVQDLISALSILPNTAFKFETFDNLSITLISPMSPA